MQTSNATTPKSVSPLKVLLMGPPGSYKTTFMLNVFDGLHILDLDHNLDGPEGICRRGLIENGKIILPPIKPSLDYTFDDCRADDNGDKIDVEECYDRVIDILNRFTSMEKYKARQAVGVDSLSHLNEFIIRKVMKLRGKDGMEIRLWTDFATYAYQVLVGKLDRTGKTIICTCHEEKITEPDAANIMKKNLVEVNPLFSGRVGDSLGAFFTDVWKLEKRKAPGGIELILMTNRTPKIEILKNSLGMPAEVDLTKRYGVMQQYLKGRV